MRSRNAVALLLTVVSLALLVPGLTRPVLTIMASINAMGQTREIFRQTQTIVEAVKRLHESGNNFVAGLILLFSIMIPLIKAALLSVILAHPRIETRGKVYRFVRS